MLAYRVKVTLANVAEEFANLCYADNFGCVQSIASKQVQSIAFLDSTVECLNYLNRRETRTNEFIERFIKG